MTVPMVFSAWGGTFLVQGLGVDPVVSSNILMVGNIASCIGGVTIALVCKKIPAKPLVVISYIVISACVALLAVFTTQLSTIAYAVIFVIMGFTFYTSTTSVYALMREMCGVKFIGGFMGASNFISWLVGNALVSTIWGLFIPADFSIAGFRNALFFQLAISIVGLIGFIALKPGMLKGCSDKDIAALEAALETQKAAD
jgi:membrane protein